MPILTEKQFKEVKKMVWNPKRTANIRVPLSVAKPRLGDRNGRLLIL